MTTVHHTPYAFLSGLTAAGDNVPLGQLDAAIVTVEDKLGTGESTPVAGTLLAGTGTGTSAWQSLADLTAIVTIRASGGDDLAALQAATAVGATIVLPDPLYLVSDQWWISASGVRVVMSSSTVIRASTTITGAVVRIGATAVPTGAASLCTDVTIEGGTIDTAGIADQGLLIHCAERPHIDRTKVIGPNGTGETAILMAAFVDASAWNRNRDFVLRGCDVTVTGLARGFVAGTGTASEGPTYKGDLYDVTVAHQSGIGYSLGVGDDVRMYDCDALPTGPAYSLEFREGCSFVAVHGGYPLRTANGTIAEDLDSSETSIEIAAALPFPTSGSWTLIVGDEEMTVTGGQGTTTLTVTRAVNGTTAPTLHANGTNARRLGSGVVVRGAGLASPAFDITMLGLSRVDSGNQVELEKGGRAYVIDSRGRHTLVPDERSFASWTEEFGGSSVASGSIGQHGWQTHGTTPFSYRAPEANRLCLGRISTDGSASTPFGISMSTVGLFLPEEMWECIWKVRLNDLGSMTARFGLAVAGEAGTDQPGGVFFEKTDGLGNWQVVTATAAGGGAAETTTNTTRIAVEDTWYTVRMRLRRDGVIGFTIGTRWANNQDNWTHTTDVPTAALTPFAQIVNPSGVAVRTADLALMSCHVLGMDRR